MKIVITADLDDTAASVNADAHVQKIIAEAKKNLWRELSSYYGSEDVRSVEVEVQD